MTDRRQSLVVVDQLGRDVPHLHQQHDETVEALKVANVTAAVALGLQVGQAAIRQVLTGGPGPLGERNR